MVPFEGVCSETGCSLILPIPLFPQGNFMFWVRLWVSGGSYSVTEFGLLLMPSTVPTVSTEAVALPQTEQVKASSTANRNMPCALITENTISPGFRCGTRDADRGSGASYGLSPHFDLRIDDHNASQGVKGTAEKQGKRYFRESSDL